MDENNGCVLVRTFDWYEPLHIHLAAEDFSTCTIIYIPSADHEIGPDRRDFALSTVCDSETSTECRGYDDESRQDVHGERYSRFEISYEAATS
jgi:hypothetical protein